MSASSVQRSRVDEEEDLDDLDDVLDQFSAPVPQPASANAPTSSQPSQPEADTLSDDFSDEFARGMESLLKELGVPRGTGAGAGSEGTGTDGDGDGSAARERERARLATAWEAMLAEDMNTMLDPSAATSSSRSTEPDFQSRIRSTVNRLHESESGLNPSDSGAGAGAGGDPLESLLSQLGGAGPQSDEQIQGMLEEMMGQLMSKDVLYEPLKELHEKFPGYLTEHASTISREDKARYEAQMACIKRLIDEFEAGTYRDDDERAHERIVALMSELQAHGQPPEEIMGPLPPGLNLGSDGLPDMPDGCNMN